MEKPIDSLRVKMWIDRYEEVSFRLRDAQEQCGFLVSQYHNLKEENLRLQGCLMALVDAGTEFLASMRASIDGIDGSREAQFRDAIEVGKEELDGK